MKHNLYDLYSLSACLNTCFKKIDVLCEPVALSNVKAKHYKQLLHDNGCGARHRFQGVVMQCWIVWGSNTDPVQDENIS